MSGIVLSVLSTNGDWWPDGKQCRTVICIFLLSNHNTNQLEMPQMTESWSLPPLKDYEAFPAGVLRRDRWHAPMLLRKSWCEVPDNSFVATSTKSVFSIVRAETHRIWNWPKSPEKTDRLMVVNFFGEADRTWYVFRISRTVFCTNNTFPKFLNKLVRKLCMGES